MGKGRRPESHRGLGVIRGDSATRLGDHAARRDAILSTLVEHHALVPLRKAFHRHGLVDDDGFVDGQLVGGGVRDAERLERSDDADLDVTTSRSAEEVRAALDDCPELVSIDEAGTQFGVTIATFEVPGPGGRAERHQVEIAQWRGETYQPGSRDPVVYAEDSLEADLARRDLTINSMAARLPAPGDSYDPSAIVDPYGGAEDIQNGVLRSPGDAGQRMAEDRLRVVRAMRFASLYGYQPDENLDRALAANAEGLRERAEDGSYVISTERVTAEVDKALKSPNPETVGNLMEQSQRYGLDDVVFRGLDTDAVREGAGDRLSTLTNPTARLTALSFPSHQQGGRVAVAATLREQKRSNDQIQQVQDTAEVAGSLADGARGTDAASLVRRFDDRTLDDAVQVAKAYGVLGDGASRRLSKARKDAERLRASLPVDGHDAMSAGNRGRAVGEALKRVEQAFLRDPGLSREEALGLLGSEQTG